MRRDPTPGERHLTAEGFDQYLNSRVPLTLRVPGDPTAFIFIEPVAPELGLRIEIGHAATAPSTGLRNIVSRIVQRDGKRYLEVVVTVTSLFRDAYPVLCSMIDRVQLSGATPAAALRATLDKMSSLLRVPESISRDQEIGLFGELLLVGGLVEALGSREAIQSWRGGQAEEHDFGLPDLDIEVKTTAGERRAHWIESLTQLVPTSRRALWLVSYQLTGAGAGDGKTLPALVDLLRETLGSGDVRDGFENGLAGSGWNETERDRLTTVWTRRTDTAAFAVVDDFPRLTADSLRSDEVPLDRILDVKYRIDLNGLTSHLPIPDVITKAIGFKG